MAIVDGKRGGEGWVEEVAGSGRDEEVGYGRRECGAADEVRCAFFVGGCVEAMNYCT